MSIDEDVEFARSEIQGLIPPGQYYSVWYEHMGRTGEVSECYWHVSANRGAAGGGLMIGNGGTAREAVNNLKRQISQRDTVAEDVAEIGVAGND